MKFYLAPLEGITGYIFRNAYEQCFGGVDKYFIPFIQPNQKGHFSAREKADVQPEHNRGMRAVPQILTKCSEDFTKTMDKLREYGYDEVNLNLGCPSKTVVSKGRGAGFLEEPEQLDRFLDEVFRRNDVKISIKTRIGKEDDDYWERLIQIYNRYPLEELIVHPRLQTDYYKKPVHMDAFDKAYGQAQASLCYNGDLVTVGDYNKIAETYPKLNAVMLGRGILRNPGLILQIRKGEITEKEDLRRFHDIIYKEYQEILFGEKNVLFKMKELWIYLSDSFADGGKCAKKIKKANSLAAYKEAVEEIFAIGIA